VFGLPDKRSSTVLCNSCGAKKLAVKISQSFLRCGSSNIVQQTGLCILFSAVSESWFRKKI
jgi:hypothetical protein